MPSGRAIFASSEIGISEMKYQGDGECDGRKLTVREVDAEMAAVGEGVGGYEVALCVFDAFAFLVEFLAGEGPEFALGRFPVAGRHCGVWMYGMVDSMIEMMLSVRRTNNSRFFGFDDFSLSVLVARTASSIPIRLIHVFAVTYV
jgi:hypothetical protein